MPGVPTRSPELQEFGGEHGGDRPAPSLLSGLRRGGEEWGAGRDNRRGKGEEVFVLALWMRTRVQFKLSANEIS